MEKFFTFVCIIAVGSAGNLGYNYQNALTNVLPPSSENYQAVQTSPIYQNEGVLKQFYYFNAPEEYVESVQTVQKIPTHTQTRQNKQTIFVKPPEQKVDIAPTQNAVADRTDKYAQTKEPSYTATAAKVETLPQATVNHHEPEIHFIKYNTPAEANQIIQSIIQHYGGNPSEIVHGSSAPVVNFSSSSKDGKDQHFLRPSVSRQYLAPKPVAATSVDNNYAKNFLPSGPDVVPGSSYLPPVLRF